MHLRPLAWRRSLASGLGGLACAEVLLAAALTLLAGMSLREALDAFVVTNGLMGASFGAAGWLIAWHRPANPVGWLLLGDGLGHATSALMAPCVPLLQQHGGSMSLQRLASTVLMYSWPWSITLFLPLALLTFPDGRPPSPRWRPAVWLIVLTAPLFVVEEGLNPAPMTAGFPSGYLTAGWYPDLAPLWTASEILVCAVLVLPVVALVVRYRRGSERERRQLLWLVLAAILVGVAVLPWSFIAGTPVVVLLAIPLVPVAVAVAIVREQLLDIRLVISRAVAWLLLSALVLVSYVGLVAVLDTFVSARLGRSVVATVLVAIVLAPLLPRLQRRVDRWMYGDRGDPARLASRVGAHLSTGDERGLEAVVEGLRAALRLPYVGLSRRGETLAEDGERPVWTTVLLLQYGGQEVGRLDVGLRPGEKILAAADRKAMELVAGPLAVALRALDLSADLQRSRERIVIGREEERRRLRRDLHDGLGPALTGIAMTADAAANLFHGRPDQVQTLLGSLRRDTRMMITDVRRLVDDLRPPALDELGLLGAIRKRADQLAWRADGSALVIRLDIPDTLPTLPAAIEVAAYRIATEALTNVARHADASAACVQLRCATSLDLEVTDDGGGDDGWLPGVGLHGMRERATEVGGRFEAGPNRTGGRVFVTIPLGTS